MERHADVDGVELRLEPLGRIPREGLISLKSIFLFCRNWLTRFGDLPDKSDPSNSTHFLINFELVDVDVIRFQIPDDDLFFRNGPPLEFSLIAEKSPFAIFIEIDFLTAGEFPVRSFQFGLQDTQRVRDSGC